jgi:small-conductance mechanosensitive channel
VPAALLRCYGRFRHGSRQFRARFPGFTALSQARDEQPTTPSPLGRHVDRLREMRASMGLTPEEIRHARLRLLVYGLLVAGVILLWNYRAELFGLPSCDPTDQSCRAMAGTTLLQIFVVVALLILGWQIARDIGRAFAPLLFRKLDPAVAGTAGFLIRLAGLAVALLLALGIADVSITAIAIAVSASAVVIGLAAQQTLGNLFAGIVLLSAHPFRVGDTVRLQGGQVGGQVEGVVSSLGLMYTALVVEGDPVLIPNSAVLAAAIRPLQEPEMISLRARLRDGRTPAELRSAIEDQLTIPLRRRPEVALEEVDGTDVVVTITATPQHPPDGGRLASELLEVVTRETGSEDAGGDGGSGDHQTAT